MFASEVNAGTNILKPTYAIRVYAATGDEHFVALCTTRKKNLV
jgi:hypothetical protein